jgi:quercetin dioxygenase-like cupin family protein
VRYAVLPGDKTANHGNPNNVIFFLTDANAKFTTPDGKTTELHGKAGAVAWRNPTTHEVENTGDKAIEGIMVVPKKPPRRCPPAH